MWPTSRTQNPYATLLRIESLFSRGNNLARIVKKDSVGRIARSEAVGQLKLIQFLTNY